MIFFRIIFTICGWSHLDSNQHHMFALSPQQLSKLLSPITSYSQYLSFQIIVLISPITFHTQRSRNVVDRGIHISQWNKKRWNLFYFAKECSYRESLMHYDLNNYPNSPAQLQVIPNYCHSYPKGMKIGRQRHPYLQVI